MNVHWRGYITIALLALAGDRTLSATPEQMQTYEVAQTLGKCAGMLEFASQLQMASGNEAAATDLHQKANGWRIATMGALQEAGWADENLVTTADGIYEGALTGWKAQLEQDAANLAPALQAQTDICHQHDALQEVYRMLIKLNALTKDGQN